MHEEAKKYKHHWTYQLINNYVFPDDIEEWDDCPVCNAKPKIWLFDNGEKASCKCHNSEYDHFTIHAECVMSYLHNNGNFGSFESNMLKKNWNHWCKTGEVLFQKPREDGRW